MKTEKKTTEKSSAPRRVRRRSPGSKRLTADVAKAV